MAVLILIIEVCCGLGSDDFLGVLLAVSIGGLDKV